jgi:hypothetical protein
VDGAPENEEKLLAEGTFTCHMGFNISLEGLDSFWSLFLFLPEGYSQENQSTSSYR